MTTPMIRSRYTLAEPWDDGRGILLNSFSGAVDVVSADTVRFVQKHPEAELDPASDLGAVLVERGYYVGSREVEDACARLVAKRAKERALLQGMPKYMFGLTLKCNLACGYCWQVQEHGEKRQDTELMSDEMVASAFAYIDRDMARRGKKRAFISLFGGEPLIDRPDFRRLVRKVGEESRARGLHVHFTTNGKDLAAFREEISLFRPSIQVTVDGVEFDEGKVVLMRDNQRLTGVYETLMDIAAAGSGSLFLRFLLHAGAVDSFVALAEDVYASGKLDQNFQLAVAPVQNKSDLIDPRIPPKFRVLAALMRGLKGKSYAPKIAYLDWRSLNVFNDLRGGDDMLPDPMFFHCEANVDLTCFDHNGLLYACYEAIGEPDLAIGKYHPDVEIDEKHLSEYRDRSAFSMPECADCSVSPICGGGCEVRGIKKNGTYMHPYCDSLHAETKLVLRQWREVSQLLTGASHADKEEARS